MLSITFYITSLIIYSVRDHMDLGPSDTLYMCLLFSYMNPFLVLHLKILLLLVSTSWCI